MQARRPRFKDESGTLVSPAEVRLDREFVPLLWVFFPGVLCFFLQGRTLGRTIEGDTLAFNLGWVGILIGTAVGFWRLRSLWRAMQELSPCWQTGSLADRYRRDRAALVIFYALASAIFAVSVGGLANRLMPIGQLKVERAVVARMSGHGSKGGSFWLHLQIPERHYTERIPVSASQFRDYRVLDVVEVHSRRGILGYDYITNIVKVGSQRISN